MSLKHTTKILLLAIICSAGFISAFNSDRLQDENSEIKKSNIIPERETQRPVLKSLNHQHKQDVNGNHKHVTPDQLIEPQEKRAKGLKRRHNRNRRDRYSRLPTTFQELARSFGQNDLAAYNYQQQQIWQNPTFPSYSPYVIPNEIHNTFVPNGPQVNNYYSHFSGTGQTSWQQQSAVLFSLFGTSNPFIVILRPPQIPQPIIPPTNPTVNVTVDDRFSFNEDPPTGVAERRNTTTGISLDIATPPRRPSRPLPPIQRTQSSLLATGESKMVAQESRRPMVQFSQVLPQSINFVPSVRPTIAQGSYNIGLAPPAGSIVSPCVWAIAYCCEANRGNQPYQERCFEAVGCPGAFYDMNPCNGQLARAAEQAAGIQNNA